MTNDIYCHGARMVLLGAAECGKTTLQRALRTGPSAPSNIYAPTNVMECQLMPVGDGPKQVHLAIWDLAGGPGYADSLQQYLVDGSLYLLCVPCLDVEKLQAGYDVRRPLPPRLRLTAPNAVVCPC